MTWVWVHIGFFRVETFRSLTHGCKHGCPWHWFFYFIFYYLQILTAYMIQRNLNLFYVYVHQLPRMWPLKRHTKPTCIFIHAVMARWCDWHVPVSVIGGRGLIISNCWVVEDQRRKWMGKLDDWKMGRLIRSGDGWMVGWGERGTDFHALTLSCLSSSSLASLIRGQVLTTDGTPLVGVNVSFVNYPHYGYTLTRQDGMYVQ